jgi:predicted nucleic-acid-binding protein
MIGLDTDVLVRFLVRDDQRQFERARRLLEQAVERRAPMLISLPVLLETEWVLRNRYALPKEEIARAISALLDSAEVRFEDEPAVEQALYAWRDSAAEFSDCVIDAHHRTLGVQAALPFDSRPPRIATFAVRAT